MFKQLAASFLLIAFIAQTFTGSLIRLDYFANESAYAKNCINKAKPKMHCNGKCQVMKKMQEEKKEQENTANKYQFKIDVLSSKSFFYAGIMQFSSLIDKATTLETITPLSDIAYGFFRPPQV